MQPHRVMRRVVIESPLRAKDAVHYEINREYARACMADSIERGEAPFAGHLLYDQPGILDDTVKEQRRVGILAHLLWAMQADVCVLYEDLGISDGMQEGRLRALNEEILVEHRMLPPPVMARLRARWDSTEWRQWVVQHLAVQKARPR